MYSPYISLIKKMFPNAEIIIDKFHLINLVSTALNKTRIYIMKNYKKNYNKLKRYWKLLLMQQEKLNNSKWKRWLCFDEFMTQSGIVNHLINISHQLKETYEMYQSVLYSLKNNDFKQLEIALNCKSNKLSIYMKTAIQTLKKYLPHIKNTLSNPYSNWFVEENNNFIKVLKRIAFGFRVFRRFKARIMICKNLLHEKKANTY